MDDIHSDVIITGDCNYCDPTSACDLSDSIIHINIRSLAPKISELEILLNILKYPKVMLISETWLSNNSPAVSVDGYSLVSSPRCSGRGGGVAAYVRNSVLFSIKDKSSNNAQHHSIDYLLLEMPRMKLSLSCMYIPPNTPLPEIISTLASIRLICNPNTSLLIGGDFNINLLDTHAEIVNEFLNEVHTLSLHPVITLPTRVTDTTATLIDNFLCDFALLPASTSVLKTDISDHYMIQLKLEALNPTVKFFRRNFSYYSKQKFSSKLCVANWNSLYSITDTDKAFTHFIRKLKRIYNKSFPFKSYTAKECKTPWLTPAILKSIRHKNALYHKLRIDKNTEQEYKKYRNNLTKTIRLAKYNYHKNILNEFKYKSSKLWKHLNDLIGASKSQSIPIESNKMNEFFTSVFRQAPLYDPTNTTPLPNETFNNHSMFLSHITSDDVIHAFASLSNSNAIGSDGFLPEIIKQNAVYLSHHLAYIFNLSFSQGIFPKILKSALVIPVYKSGSHSDPSNYRPISILTVFSKLLEKLFYNRLIAFIEKYQILHFNQFGFRKNKSTSTAIACVLSSLLNKCSSKIKTILALLDLKKAFDFINHNLLIRKLQHYGIRGTPLLWLMSYLSNRSQKVKANNILSDVQTISAGVPQGSILGPLLFIIFINDVFQFCSHNIEIYLYADDTALIFSAKNDNELQATVNSFFDAYSIWCTRNCIVVNPTKSNYMRFNTSETYVTINGHLLECLHVVKYLGVYIDDKLAWNYQVAHITNMCCQRIGIMKKVLLYLPNFVSVLYFNAFIRSCYSFCVMFWINNDRSSRFKLIDKIDRVISILANKHNLSVDAFVNKFKICDVWKVWNLQNLAFMYDLWHNSVTVPFITLDTNNSVHSHLTRASSNLHIELISTIDKHNFIYNAKLDWNHCPVELRNVRPKSKFMSQCKKLLFHLK
jgi:hypothetical protein